MASPRNQYFPDVVSPPGATLNEVLRERCMTQADLSERSGRPRKTINEIIKGKTAITPQTALELERVLGVPASFWNERERLYRESLARHEEDARLKHSADWLKELPVGDMVRLGWIRQCRTKLEKLRECLGFFGVASPKQWHETWAVIVPQAAFRRSTAFKCRQGAVAAWLRRGELEAVRVPCRAFDESRFKQTLLRIRAMTRQEPSVYEPELKQQCAAAGVAVVLVPEVSGVHASGAMRWLTPSRAMIQLSLRYGTDDQLWFSFFHEARHVLQNRRKRVFVDLERPPSKDAEEQDADHWAASFLIPDADYQRFLAGTKHISTIAVEEFASRLGIAPGIVVGRLQHDRRIAFTHLNGLKTRLRLAQSQARNATDAEVSPLS